MYPSTFDDRHFASGRQTLSCRPPISDDAADEMYIRIWLCIDEDGHVLRRAHPQFEIQLVEATTEIPEKSSRLLSCNKGLNFIAVILDLTYSVLNPQDKIRISNVPRDASDSWRSGSDI